MFENRVKQRLTDGGAAIPWEGWGGGSAREGWLPPAPPRGRSERIWEDFGGCECLVPRCATSSVAFPAKTTHCLCLEMGSHEPVVVVIWS